VVEKTRLVRALTYCAVGILPFLANLGSFKALIAVGMSIELSTGIGFMVGGQVSFWSHDRLTFGDRHVSLKGWRLRWVKFMPGQFLGIALNSLTANALVENTGASDTWVFALAMLVGVIGTYSWNNLVSHAAPKLPRETDGTPF